jgi:hypothetical protein
MQRKRLLFVLVSMFIAAAARAQPAVDLPSDADAPATALPRETPIENPMGRRPAIQGSAFGGYGELTLNALQDAPAIVDLRRFVLFFGHNFSDRLRFYSEVEVEHAVASSADEGEIEIEQAYLDALFSGRFNLRAGIVILPVGIINVYHEPPTFNGVDRPDVDTFVIPTTWREPAVGIFGQLTNSLRYQLYVVNGLNANGFTADAGLREGTQEGQLARAGYWGAVARLDWEPRLGTVLGASGYHATSGYHLTSMGPTPMDLVGKTPVTLLEADLRTRAGGFTARAEVAVAFIDSAGALDAAFAQAASPDAAPPPVSSRLQGAYVELGYDLLRLLRPGTPQALTLFGRYDWTDTQAAVPAGFTADPALRRRTYTAGLVYRPIPEIGLKLDYRRHEFGAGDGLNEIATALTWMF